MTLLLGVAALRLRSDRGCCAFFMQGGAYSLRRPEKMTGRRVRTGPLQNALRRGRELREQVPSRTSLSWPREPDGQEEERETDS